ncbi:MAG: large conductance mechanosensitive channel protein MscL [Coprothermobacterota bacterium]|nr:large conductance mechanosensitive channel protein MscL [Coprothermobacterota bacterium]
MWKEFKEFALKGSLIDMTVGIILGAATSTLVKSLINDVIMPPIGMLLGKVDFSNLFINLSRTHYASLTEAKAAGAPTINYGVFLNEVLNFLVVSFVLFLIIRQINRFRRKKEAPAPATKECPYCLSQIPSKATRCPHCTSQL